METPYQAVYTVKLADAVLCTALLPKEIDEGDRDACRSRTTELIEPPTEGSDPNTREKDQLIMAAKRTRTPEDSVTGGSGNVFANLGLRDADTLPKSVLAIHIKRAINARHFTQAKAAEILGLDQPKVSAIISGRLDGFSTDRLMRSLNELGCDVEISVSQRRIRGRPRACRISRNASALAAPPGISSAKSANLAAYGRESAPRSWSGRETKTASIELDMMTNA